MAVNNTARLGRNKTRDEKREQSREALPENLICPLPYRFTKMTGSKDLLSRSQVHTGAWVGVDYDGGARGGKISISLMCVMVYTLFGFT